MGGTVRDFSANQVPPSTTRIEKHEQLTPIYGHEPSSACSHTLLKLAVSIDEKQGQSPIY